MHDLRAPALHPAHGERLSRDAYRQDFRARDQAIVNGNSWKLERRQHFEEQNHPGRDALRRGDWPEALRLLETRRAAMRAEGEDDARRGSSFHRVRIVEEPLTPYVQWELHSLRQQAEYGQRVRVLAASAVADDETHGVLPELAVLGGHTLYRVLYTDAGVPTGAIRYTAPETVTSWLDYIRHAYAAAEDVQAYFTRVVAHLPPPPAA